MLALITECDGPFKTHLDRYKYDTRYVDADKITERAAASVFLKDLDRRLSHSKWLFGSRPCLTDFAILPFVRQFANSGREWFDAQDWEELISWLIEFERSLRFATIMPKFAKWQAGDQPIMFP
jgi:glutathione S-transferase